MSKVSFLLCPAWLGVGAMVLVWTLGVVAGYDVIHKLSRPLGVCCLLHGTSLTFRQRVEA